MAWSFGDGFDLYAASTDAINGYWDSGSAGFYSLQTGRFSGSRCWASSSNSNLATLTKSSGSNDAVHHIAVAFQTTTALGGASQGGAFTLYDGTTAQVSIGFDRTGSIQLIAGANSSGTVLATYSSAFSAANTWYQFEFEVVIHPSAGTFKVRKNGNTTEDFTATGLNTRQSANSYANKLSIVTGANANFMTAWFDDLFWKSDASSVAWLGDLRCYTRMPASDQSVQFSRVPVTPVYQPWPTGGANNTNSGQAYYTAFTAPPTTDPIVTVNLLIRTAYTGNVKCAFFASAAGQPGALLATATAPVTNPAVGNAVFTFSPGITITAGAQYFVGFCFDAATVGVTYGATGATPLYFSNTAYASFPVANPGVGAFGSSMTMTYLLSAPRNYSNVSEFQQDALTTYIYSSNSGDADLYGIASISGTPATVIATTVRGYAQKSDAGSRTLAVQVKSGATTVASAATALSTSGWQWVWRTDLTDPNTGSPWTAVAVNAVQIGPKVVT